MSEIQGGEPARYRRDVTAIRYTGGNYFACTRLADWADRSDHIMCRDTDRPVVKTGSGVVTVAIGQWIVPEPGSRACCEVLDDEEFRATYVLASEAPR